MTKDHDLISRQAAIDKAIMIPVARIVTEDKVLWRKAVFVEDIEALPPVDAVPVRRGKWKAVTEDGEEYKRICSCCGKEAPFNETERVYLIYPHCPWCGARMGVSEG